jgi:hypothetical protein
MEKVQIYSSYKRTLQQTVFVKRNEKDECETEVDIIFFVMIVYEPYAIY